jgi:hypothetical protein
LSVPVGIILRECNDRRIYPKHWENRWEDPSLRSG